ncbi:hypothetical protein [Haloechinothrix halophila]|uniref:hypothetical protein n=1 Tax=Haloechinothrix halophila TaxID=1069073 RepID=UPI0012FCD950|nr:hypothetical protein [Haloechinothrix halophila]
MSEQPYPSSPLSPEPSQKPRRRWPWITGGVFAAVVVIAAAMFAGAQLFGGAQIEPRSGATSTNNAVEPSTATAAEATTEPIEFTPEMFTLKVKILSRDCYGSAGCLVDYRVVPTYLGDSSDLEGVNLEMTYEVTGATGGSDIGTVTFENGEYDVYDVEGDADTASAKSKLKARVTELEWY